MTDLNVPIGDVKSVASYLGMTIEEVEKAKKVLGAKTLQDLYNYREKLKREKNQGVGK